MLPPPSTEQCGCCDSRKILPGSKKYNKDHHPAARGAVLKALLLLPFQPSFTSAVTAPLLRDGEAASATCSEQLRGAGWRSSIHHPHPVGKDSGCSGLHWNPAWVISVEIDSLQPHPLWGKYCPGRQPCRDTPKTCGSKVPVAPSLPKIEHMMPPWLTGQSKCQRL